jgi:hypothetical protein
VNSSSGCINSTCAEFSSKVAKSSSAAARISYAFDRPSSATIGPSSSAARFPFEVAGPSFATTGLLSTTAGYGLSLLISYYHSQEDLLSWIIKLWTYKIVGGNIYYRGRINEYPSMVVGERIFYHG